MPQHETPDGASSADDARDTPGHESLDDGFAPVQGSAPWAQRLTRRAKLLRIAVVVGVVALAVSVIGGSSLVMRFTNDRPAAHAPSNLRSALPFPILPTTSRRGSLPASAYTTSINAIDLAPGISQDANVAPGWVCWVTDPRQPSPAGPSALHAARTLDGGLSWREVALPITSASSCDMEVAHDTPSLALVAVTTASEATSACSTRLLLTRDNGDHWNELSPAQAYASACAAHYSLLAGAIFVAAGAESALGQSQRVESWSLSGASSWTPAQTDRPNLIVTAVAGARANGRLVGAALFTDPNDGMGQLVESADGGVTWSAIGSLSGSRISRITLFMDERASEQHAPDDPIYALADLLPHGSGDWTLLRWNDERSFWVALPAIPHLQNAPDPLSQADFAAIGVGQDGGLLVVAPGANQQEDDQSRQDFWYWNVRAQRWLVSESQVALVMRPYGIGWSANNATLWLIYAHLGVPAHVELYTTTLA